jgi:hypothetical protein
MRGQYNRPIFQKQLCGIGKNSLTKRGLGCNQFIHREDAKNAKVKIRLIFYLCVLRVFAVKKSSRA